jgi:hypothetical protein
MLLAIDVAQPPSAVFRRKAEMISTFGRTQPRAAVPHTSNQLFRLPFPLGFDLD